MMMALKFNPYPGYKQTGFGWIDRVPNHWGVSRIKRIHRQTTNSFIDGDWVESPYIVDDEKIRYITSGNIGEGRFKFQGSGHISEESFEELNCVEVFPGDLVVSRLSLPIGRSCIIPDLGKRIITAVDNVIVRLNSKCNKNFYNYLFNSFESYENTTQLARGTTLQRISRTMLGDIETLVPPLIEQKKIVQFLDGQCNLINPIIQRLGKKRKLLSEKRSAIITQAATKGLNPDAPMKDSGIDWIGEIPNHWQTNQLKKQFTFKKGRLGQILTASFLEDSEDKFPVHSGQTKDGGVLGFWDQYEFNFPDGVIFSTTVGAKCMSTKWISGKFSLSQNCMIMIPKGVVVDSKYGEYYLRYYFAEEKKKLPLIMQPSLRYEDLNQFQILIPPIDEQRQISTHLNIVEKSIDGVKDSIDIQIKRLKEYRTALISAAVTGKIDLRGL